VRMIRLRYRLGSMTLTEPIPLDEPLAVCETSAVK